MKNTYLKIFMSAGLMLASLLGISAAQANSWVSAKNGDIPEGAIRGGEEDAGVLFICRARFREGVHPGKIRRGFRGCHIGWGGREHSVSRYQVLTRDFAGGERRERRDLREDQDDRDRREYRQSSFWERHKNGRIPSDALKGGGERGRVLYVCRAKFKGGVHFGKIRRDFDGCHIGWGGREQIVRKYDVLIAKNVYWEPHSNGRSPSDAVGGGRERDGTPLYVCRARFKDGMHPGKVRRGFRGCNIGWGGRERTISDYEVLIRE